MFTDPTLSLTGRLLRIIDCFGDTMAPEARRRRAGRLLAEGG
jgi:hypothetical protein